MIVFIFEIFYFIESLCLLKFSNCKSKTVRVYLTQAAIASSGTSYPLISRGRDISYHKILYYFTLCILVIFIVYVHLSLKFIIKIIRFSANIYSNIIFYDI